MKKKTIVCDWCKTREAVQKATQVTQFFSNPKKQVPLGEIKIKFKEISVCDECAKHKLRKSKK